MKNIVVILAVSVFIVNTGFCESPIISGSLIPYTEAEQIYLYNEHVRIKLDEKNYSVNANYTFYNEFSSTSVIVGLPRNYPLDEVSSARIAWLFNNIEVINCWGLRSN